MPFPCLDQDFNRLVTNLNSLTYTQHLDVYMAMTDREIGTFNIILHTTGTTCKTATKCISVKIRYAFTDNGLLIQ